LSLTELVPATSNGPVAPSTEARPELAQLTLDGQGPMWLQIRRALAQPILSGLWRSGARIPAELDLRDHFRTSRMTVNKAIQSLANEGLVHRRPRIGTVVSQRAQERPVFEIWDIADVITRSGATYGYRLLECAFVGDDPAKRALLAVERRTQLLWMRCLHLSDGRPFQLEERLVNIDAAPGITCQPLETTSPGAWLLGHVPWTEAEHTISAVEAGSIEAEALGVPVGSACLVVERRTWDSGQPVTLARMWNPGAQHRLVGRFKPSR
jgi:GntR family histidine utilization transcriptional repressor